MGDFSKELEGLSVEERYRAVMNHEYDMMSARRSGSPTYRGRYDGDRLIPLDFCDLYGLRYIGRPIYVHVYQKIVIWSYDDQALKQFMRFSYSNDNVSDTLEIDQEFETKKPSYEGCIVMGENQFLLVKVRFSHDFEYPYYGYRIIEVDVFDEEPDLKSGDYPKTEPSSKDIIKYTVYDYASANEIAFKDLNK